MKKGKISRPACGQSHMHLTCCSPLIPGQRFCNFELLCPLCHLTRRFAVINSRPQERVRACFEEDINGGQIPVAYRHVQACVVINPALVRIGAIRQEKVEDVEHIPPSR